jgi:gliding motility-associated-like protein
MPFFAFAGQFLGGELSYRIVYSDPTSTRYAVTLKMYRNCSSLADLPDPTISFLNTLDIAQNTNPLKYIEEVFTGRSITLLPRTSINPCVVNTPPDCYQLITWTKEIDLPHSPEGYTLWYTFCCRDDGSTNIRKDTWNGGSETVNGVIVPGQGFSLVARIPRPDAITHNSSPIVTADSVILSCLQREINYRFQFTDPDGDSLVYTIAKPYALSNSSHTTFQELFYNTGYSTAEPMAGSPKITLNPVTGVLKGTPDRKGFFILSLEIKEYRNQKLICTHRKEVQLNVYDCSISKPNDILNCNSRTVSVLHTNSDRNKYFWDMGVDTSTRDTSSALLPVYVYPGAGEYKVKATVTNPENGCSDTTALAVKIFPKINIDFSANTPVCNGDPLVLTDASSTGMGTITKWTWKNATRSMVLGRDKTLTYNYTVPNNQIYPVSAWLVVEASNGCKDSTLKAFNIYPRAKAFAGPDTTISFDQPYKMQGSGGNTYKWDPPVGLSNPAIANPILSINRDQRYTLEVSNDGFCSGKDTVFIRYMKGPDVYVPDAFTPNNDGLNDVFRVYGVSIRVKSFEIFNRFGHRVFSSTNLEKGWDGTINRIPQHAGTYVWCVNGEDEKGNPVVKKGTVLLIR